MLVLTFSLKVGVFAERRGDSIPPVFSEEAGESKPWCETAPFWDECKDKLFSTYIPGMCNNMTCDLPSKKTKIHAAKAVSEHCIMHSFTAIWCMD